MGILTLENLEFLKDVCICLCFFLCYVKEISTDMLEEQVSEERDMEINQGDDIRMEYSSE